MKLELVNRLAMLGIALIGIGNMLYNPEKDIYEIQKQVIMDMGDISDLEREIKERKRKNEQELYFKGYKIVLKK